MERKSTERREKVYIAIELEYDALPTILGVFRKKSDAEKLYGTVGSWVNIIEKELK